GLPSDFPPLRTLESGRHNLPIRTTALIGREREVEAARRQLLRDDVRLLTLTGPGGTGKTRLAQHVAAELLDRFEQGVCFVGLAAISEAGLVASGIARALDVREVAGQPLVETLKGYLRARSLLL